MRKNQKQKKRTKIIKTLCQEFAEEIFEHKETAKKIYKLKTDNYVPHIHYEIQKINKTIEDFFQEKNKINLTQKEILNFYKLISVQEKIHVPINAIPEFKKSKIFEKFEIFQEAKIKKEKRKAFYRALKAIKEDPQNYIEKNYTISETNQKEILKNNDTEEKIKNFIENLIKEKNQKNYQNFFKFFLSPFKEDVSIQNPESLQNFYKFYLDTPYKKTKFLQSIQDYVLIENNKNLHEKTALETLIHIFQNLKEDQQQLFSHFFKTISKTINNFSETKSLKDIKKNFSLQEDEYSYLKNFKTPLSIKKITYHVGPTNSGKTYSAFETLLQSKSGQYLAPLRLMALEGYEKFQKHLIDATLKTGEEEKIGTMPFESATIETAIQPKFFETILIDEIQMLLDPQRGWAWTQALCNAQTNHLLLTGSHDGIEHIKEFAEFFNLPLEIINHTKKTKLTLLKNPIKIEELKPRDALICFSRRDVLLYKKVLEDFGFKVSCIYGNLGAEARLAQAKKFEDHNTDILISTDCIGMGLNLSIQRIIFSTFKKFDGNENRILKDTEIRQIAGRAGRYKIFDEGFVGFLENQENTKNQNIIQILEKSLNSHAKPVEKPLQFFIKMTEKDYQDFSKKYGNASLKTYEEIFKTLKIKEPIFKATENIENTHIIEELKNKKIPLETSLVYNTLPVSYFERQIFLKENEKYENITNQFVYDKYIVFDFIENHSKNKITSCPRLKDTLKEPNEKLFYYENLLKSIMLYKTLHQKFPYFYPEIEKAEDIFKTTNQFIQEIFEQKENLFPNFSYSNHEINNFYENTQNIFKNKTQNTEFRNWKKTYES